MVGGEMVSRGGGGGGRLLPEITSIDFSGEVVCAPGHLLRLDETLARLSQTQHFLAKLSKKYRFDWTDPVQSRQSLGPDIAGHQHWRCSSVSLVRDIFKY